MSKLQRMVVMDKFSSSDNSKQDGDREGWHGS